MTKIHKWKCWICWGWVELSQSVNKTTNERDTYVCERGHLNFK